MKWFVTGGAGFIGSNFSAYLLEKDEEVLVLDNFFSGKKPNIERLEKLGGNRFTFIEGSIQDEDLVKTCAAQCAVVVHLAAQVSVQRSIDLPKETHEINVTGFVNVYQAALAVGIKRFVYASSCAVYGDNETLPLSEIEVPNPLSLYAVSKFNNEQYASVLRAPNDFKAVGLRFFNVFGAWQDAAGGYAAVIPLWVASLMENDQATIFGEGDATRDFVHVHNICDALYASATNESLDAQTVMNVGTGQSTSLNELLAVIIKCLREYGVCVKHDEAVHKSWRQGDILHSISSIERANNLLSYHPKINLEQGIRLLLEEEYQLSKANS